MIKGIKKVSIVGGPGTGKSTLAKNLGKELDLPVYHIDGINYKKNWEERKKAERDKMIIDIANTDKWVIDGNYIKTLECRIKKADIIIYLNYSTYARIKGIYKRYFECRGKERKEIPGCKEKMDFKFVKYTFTWNKHVKSKLEKALNINENEKIIIFKNRKQLNKWYEKNYNKKIEKTIDIVD